MLTGEIHLENRDVGSTGEPVPLVSMPATENDDGIDVPQRLVQLVVDVTLAARDERP